MASSTYHWTSSGEFRETQDNNKEEGNNAYLLCTALYVQLKIWRSILWGPCPLWRGCNPQSESGNNSKLNFDTRKCHFIRPNKKAISHYVHTRSYKKISVQVRSSHTKNCFSKNWSYKPARATTALKYETFARNDGWIDTTFFFTWLFTV